MRHEHVYMTHTEAHLKVHKLLLLYAFCARYMYARLKLYKYRRRTNDRPSQRARVRIELTGHRRTPVTLCHTETYTHLSPSERDVIFD